MIKSLNQEINVTELDKMMVELEERPELVCFGHACIGDLQICIGAACVAHCFGISICFLT